MQEQQTLASTLGAQFPKPQPAPAPQVNVTTPKHENTVNFNLQGVDHISAKTIEVIGLKETLDEIKDWVMEAQKVLKRYTGYQPIFEVPEAKVKVEWKEMPTPKITVPPIKIPDVKVTIDTSKLEKLIKDMQPSSVQSSIPAQKAPQIAEERELYASGVYDGYEITYVGGAVERVTGYSRGRVKHEYK